MAGRIRSIKPEVLDDERVCALSDEAWRLWVSTWLLADDYGNLRAGDRYLASQVWQDSGRAARINGLLVELRAAGRLYLYESGGERFAHIENWEKHQRIDNAGRPRVPSPLDENSRLWVESRGEPPRVAASLGDSPLDHRPPTTDHRPPKGGLALVADQPKAASGHSADALQVLEALNAARSSAIRGARPLKAIRANLEHIEARLRDGHGVDDLLHVIAVCASEVRRDASAAKWFTAVTPFRKDNFGRKLGMVADADRPRRADSVDADELARAKGLL